METGLKNPLDEAILRHTEVDVSGWRKIDEVQFDFERRRVSVLADDGRERLLVLKGAFEDVLSTFHALRGRWPAEPVAARRRGAAQRRAVLRVAQSRGIPGARDRLEGDRSRPGPRGRGRRDRAGVRRIRRLRGSAEGQRGGGRPGADGERCHGQGRHRRQRARDPARVRGAGPARSPACSPEARSRR